MRAPFHRRQTRVTGPVTYDEVSAAILWSLFSHCTINVFQGFWFANLMIGVLEIRILVEVLIDTGFADLVSNPELHNTISAFENFGKTFDVTHRAVTNNTLSNNTIIFQSLNIYNQTIGIILSTSNTTSTSIYPHNGIVEFRDSSLSGINCTTYFYIGVSSRRVALNSFSPQTAFVLRLSAPSIPIWSTKTTSKKF
ncbi:uncharacterized protein EAF02_004852 [Botrytis sinoallii]|uniref:uncharacterized protein n=1 Tax=Botrytis sinoallii TaxID=1463999 RepID=UPI0019025C96|nr:uncharacterized protein EAF02_004852 [Botrytis sinoallii]KAF7884516.1 hypothetical protein EAF02_004852 [Botrytis sinoallii]